MKNIVITNAIIASVALIISLILGLLSGSSAVGMALKALFSVFLVFTVYNLLKWIIGKWLPELLTPSSTTPPEETDSLNKGNKDEEGKVNIVLPVGEQPLTEPLLDIGDLEQPKEDITPTLGSTKSYPSNNKANDKFSQEDPATLAKMVRTTLSRDEE